MTNPIDNPPLNCPMNDDPDDQAEMIIKKGQGVGTTKPVDHPVTGAPLNYDEETAHKAIELGFLAYQNRAVRTAIYPGRRKALGLLYAVLGLFNEAGELLEKVINNEQIRELLAEEKPFNESLEGMVKAAIDAGFWKKKIRDHNYHPIDADVPLDFTPKELDELQKEVGDVQWYVAGVCDELGRYCGDAAVQNLKKLADRAARGKIQGSGDGR